MKKSFAATDSNNSAFAAATIIDFNAASDEAMEKHLPNVHTI